MELFRNDNNINQGDTLLHIVARKQQGDWQGMVKWLISHGANHLLVNSKGEVYINLNMVISNSFRHLLAF